MAPAKATMATPMRECRLNVGSVMPKLIVRFENRTFLRSGQKSETSKDQRSLTQNISRTPIVEEKGVSNLRRD